MVHPKNQLDQVICQVKFLPLLIIDKDVSKFQEKIIDSYPQYENAPGMDIGIANSPVVKNHTFKSDDGCWSVTLSISSMSLTTSKYDTWSDFIDKFEFILESLDSCFHIKTFVRVGLRYVNAIRPSSLGMDGITNWNDIIQSPYVDNMNSDIGTVLGFNSIADYKIDDKCQCRSAFGTIRFLDKNEEVGFLIDNDLFSTCTVQYSDLNDILNEYHSRSEEIFKRMITGSFQKKVGL